MQSLADRKKIFVLIGAAVFATSLPLLLGLIQTTEAENQQSSGSLKYVTAEIAARRATDGEAWNAMNATTLTNVHAQLYSLLPKLKQAIDGADARWQKYMDYCALHPSCDLMSFRPVDEMERVSVAQNEVLSILDSLPKYDYTQEQFSDDGSLLLKFYQAVLEINGKYYIVTVRTLWQR